MSQLQAQIMAQPLQYAHAYLQAGRLAESLQLLRIELARNPANRQVRDLALSVARRIQDMANGGRGARYSASRFATCAFMIAAVTMIVVTPPRLPTMFMNPDTIAE